MKVKLKLASPRNHKERLFQLETQINDLKNPGEAVFTLGRKEYLLEIHFDKFDN